MSTEVELPPQFENGSQVRARDRRSSRYRSKGFIVVAAFAVLLFIAFGAPLVAPYGMDEQSLASRLQPPVGFGGTWDHVLGTDYLGRDILSRVIYGARTSIFIGGAAVTLAAVIGVSLGLIAGYKRGWREALIMRLVEVQMAFPGLLLALTILAFVGPSPAMVVIVLGINGWMVFAVLARSTSREISEAPYIEASTVAGSSPRRTMVRHVLPNAAAPLATLLVIEFARMMLAEAALSFLGLGVPPPTATWGRDIASGREYIFSAWWLVTFPGLALALTVMIVNSLSRVLRQRSARTLGGGQFADRRGM